MRNGKVGTPETDNGIGKVYIKTGTSDAVVRRMEKRLIKAGIFIAWDGTGFVVSNLQKARSVFRP